MKLNFLFVDAAKTETYFTLMTKRMAFVISLIFAVFTVLFAIIAFATPNTRVETVSKASDSTTSYSSLISIRHEYNGISNFNNFMHFDLTPKFANPTNDRYAPLVINGGFYTLSDDFQVIDFINFSKVITYHVSKESEKIKLFDINSTYFSSVVAFVDTMTSVNEIGSVTLDMTTMEAPLPISELVLSSFCCIFVIIMLLAVNIRRVRPSALDQWFTIVLIGCLFLIDGPWLVCQYFAIPGFSVVFDLMPQLFHAFFIIYVIVFFAIRTQNFKSLFSNLWLSILTFIYALVLITMQFLLTSGRQLSMMSIIEKNTGLYIAIIVLFFIYHIWVFGILALGFYDVQIDIKLSWILSIMLFGSLEIINLAVFLTRFFVISSNIGSSSAIDFFYILEANLVCFFLAYLNTPISMGGEPKSEAFLIDSTLEPQDV